MSTDKVVLVLNGRVSKPMSRESANERADELRSHGLYASICEYRPQVQEPMVAIGNRDTRYDGWESTRNTSRYGR